MPAWMDYVVAGFGLQWVSSMLISGVAFGDHQCKPTKVLWARRFLVCVLLGWSPVIPVALLGMLWRQAEIPMPKLKRLAAAEEGQLSFTEVEGDKIIKRPNGGRHS